MQGTSLSQLIDVRGSLGPSTFLCSSLVHLNPKLPCPKLPRTERCVTSPLIQTLRKMDNILYELSLSRKSAAVGEDGGGGGDA